MSCLLHARILPHVPHMTPFIMIVVSFTDDGSVGHLVTFPHIPSRPLTPPHSPSLPLTLSRSTLPQTTQYGLS